MTNIFKSTALALLAVVFFFLSQSASAQIPGSNTVSGTYTGLNHINRIINGTPGITTTSVTGGAVDASASGPVNFNRGGINVPIPTTVTGKVSAGAIATGAARMGLRALPWIGTALAIKEITDAAIKDGWKVCPPPAFFCKPDWDQPNKIYYWTQPYYGGARPTAIESCNAVLPSWDSAGGWGGAKMQPNSYNASNEVVSAYCIATNKNGVTQQVVGLFQRMNCNASNNPVASGCAVELPKKPDIPATEPDLAGSMTKEQNAKPGFGKTLYDHMKTVEQQNPSMGPVISPSAIPVTMNAPPVTYPATEVSTKTEPNADGNGTKTTTVTQQVTVTPTVGPTPTLAEPKITFPTTTTTTTTVINNVTNVTNITTEVTKEEPANVEKPEPLPKDYNREATQLKILEQLDGSTAPEAPASQEERVTAKVLDVDTKLNAELPKVPQEFDTDKSKWFSWVWVPPISQCSSSVYSTVIRGHTVAWDICPWVENIRQFVGFLWAFIGCLTIYSQMFKRGE